MLPLHRCTARGVLVILSVQAPAVDEEMNQHGNLRGSGKHAVALPAAYPGVETRRLDDTVVSYQVDAVQVVGGYRQRVESTGGDREAYFGSRAVSGTPSSFPVSLPILLFRVRASLLLRRIRGRLVYQRQEIDVLCGGIEREDGQKWLLVAVFTLSGVFRAVELYGRFIARERCSAGTKRLQCRIDVNLKPEVPVGVSRQGCHPLTDDRRHLELVEPGL